MLNHNCVVVYRSKSGFTKRYAQWISEELKCDLLQGKKVSVADLQKYDIILYGGGLYAIGLNGIKLITKNFNELKNKKLFVFGVGATPVRSETTQEVMNANIPSQQQGKIEFFYLRGGFDYKKLSPMNKLLMYLLKIKLKKAKDPDADSRGMLASYTHPVDFVKRKNIEQIINRIRSVSNDES